MKVVRVKTKNIYNVLKTWWVKHNFTPVSPAMLPEYSFVNVLPDGRYSHSVCFYNTDSYLAWVGWQVSNPDIKVKGGLLHLMRGVEEYAKQSGYKMLFTTSNTPPVQSVMKDLNYITGDINVNHYLKLI